MTCIDIIKKVPILNWFTFVFFHGAPTESDMLSIYNNIGLVSALNLAMLGGAVAAFTFDDLQKARARFQPGGEYGCLASTGSDGHLVDLFHYTHGFFPLSTNFSESVLEAVVTTCVSLFGAVILLVGVSSIGNEADSDIVSSRDSGGAFNLGGRNFVDAKVLGLNTWWWYMKIPSSLLALVFFLSIISSIMVVFNVVYRVADHPAFANACKELGWVSTGVVDDLYGEMFTCTAGDGFVNPAASFSNFHNRSSYANYDPACFVTLKDSVLFTDLTNHGDAGIDLTGGEVNYVKRALVGAILAFVLGLVLPLVVVGGYASMNASANIKNGTAEDASAAAEVMKPYETALTAAGLEPEHFENILDLVVFNSMLKEALTAAGTDSPGARADIIAACTDPVKCRKIIARRNLKAEGETKAFGF